MAIASVIFLFLSQLLVICELVQSHCPKEFECGNIKLRFPFSTYARPDCGLHLVQCHNDTEPEINVLPGRHWYIRRQHEDRILVTPSFDQGKDCTAFSNLTLPNTPAISFETRNVTMLKCSLRSPSENLDMSLHQYHKFGECEKDYYFDIYYNYGDGRFLDVAGDHPPNCSIIRWPIGETHTFDPLVEHQLFDLLDTVLLKWSIPESCTGCQSGKQCIVDRKSYTCSKESLRKHGVILIPVIFGAIAICAIIGCYLGRNYIVNPSIFWGTKKLDHKNIEKFLKNYGSLGAKRYRYSDIRRMTSSFKVKLGQGGFGSVFKGCLVDGTPVAVKLLNDSKGNGEEFINEVESISRTSHVNIVKLLGFCSEGNKRALVYEFMPKGSLEKFIFEGKSTSSDYQIGMEELFKIATGVARGLEYLHRLCGTRIVHFDVKPHNILLDVDFTPKISDFGLAKSCHREQNSILTLSGVRGTVGYIAPEIASRYFGSVSHKSDVYSYGMMVLEIVGGRKNVNNGADNSSQIYMPHWIYNQIETNQNFNFINTGNDEDHEFARKMIIVSFLCIQTDPSSRPTMTKVVELLESKVESLQIPPRPYLFSSANSPFNQSTMTKDDNLNSEIRNGGISDDVTVESVLFKDMESQ